MARLYAIKHKETGLYCPGIEYTITKTKNGCIRTPQLSFSKKPHYVVIRSINRNIARIIEFKLQSQLDDCEIEAVELTQTVIKSSIKMKNVRDRLEQEALVDTLRNGR